MKSYQSRTRGNRDVTQLSKTLGNDIAFFSKEEIEWTRQYLCNHTRTVYYENEFTDIIGEDAYTVEAFIDFRCDIMRWADDRIRLTYFNGIHKERSIGKIIDSRNGTAVRGRDAERQNPDLQDTETMRFTQAVSFH